MALRLLVVAVVVLLVPSCIAKNALFTRESLNSGQSLEEGNYRLTMQSNCNLVLYNNGRAIWATNTVGLGTSCSVFMQADRNLVIYNALGKAVWDSRTWRRRQGNFVLILQPDGNVVIYDDSIWSTGTGNVDVVITDPKNDTLVDHEVAAGVVVNRKNALYTRESLNSGQSLWEGDYSFTMHSNCNLVLYNIGKAVWATNTYGLGTNCYVTMQADRNLVIYNGLDKAVWDSRTWRRSQGNFVLILQPDGNVVMYNDAIWSTGTGTVDVVITDPKNDTLVDHEVAAGVVVNRKIAMVTAKN